MDKENMKRIKELFSNRLFVEKFVCAESIEEAQKILSDEGVNLSLDEVGKIGDTILDASKNEYEIDEKDLEDVSGGFAISLGAILLGGAIVGLPLLAGWLHGRQDRKNQCARYKK